MKRASFLENRNGIRVSKSQVRLGPGSSGNRVRRIGKNSGGNEERLNLQLDPQILDLDRIRWLGEAVRALLAGSVVSPGFFPSGRSDRCSPLVSEWDPADSPAHRRQRQGSE